VSRPALRHVVLLGHSPWRCPPSAETLNLPVATALADTLPDGLTVLVPNDEGHRHIERHGRVVVRYLGTRAAGLPTYLLRSLRAGAEVLRNRDDVLLLASDPIAGVPAKLLAAAYRAPLVFQLQGEVLHPGPEYGSRLRRAVLGLLSRRLARTAAGVRCVNTGLALDVARLQPRGLVRVVGTRVDADRWRPADNIGSTPARIAAVGALTRLKNYHVLVDAFAELVHDGLDATLDVAGDGPAAPALAARANAQGIADRVQLRGRLNQETLQRTLPAATLFAHPSLSEGQPRAVLEAMACGLPVVVSDIAAHREIVRPDESGVLVATDDTSGWAAAIRRVIEEPALRTRLGTAARREAMQRFDVEHNVRDFSRLLHDAWERA